MATDLAPAERAYAAYGQSTGGRNFLGQPMPAWSDLPETIRNAWVAAADEIRLESVGAISSLANMVQTLLDRHIQLGTALLHCTAKADRQTLVDEVQATAHDVHTGLATLAKRTMHEPLDGYTVPDWQRESLAEVTNLTWPEVRYLVRDAATHVHMVQASLDADQFEQIALLRAASATYSDVGQDLDTEKDEPGTHRHPLLLAQLAVADRLAAEAGLSCRIAPLLAPLTDSEEQLLLDRIEEAEQYPEGYSDDLPRLRGALAAVQAAKATTEYRVTFTRIGARGGKQGTEPPLPLTAQARDSDHLAELIGDYALQFLGSSDCTVSFDSELTRGTINVGVGSLAGEFTIERIGT